MEEAKLIALAFTTVATIAGAIALAIRHRSEARGSTQAQSYDQSVAACEDLAELRRRIEVMAEQINQVVAMAREQERDSRERGIRNDARSDALIETLRRLTQVLEEIKENTGRMAVAGR